jgi:hypothetical protein
MDTRKTPHTPRGPHDLPNALHELARSLREATESMLDLQEAMTALQVQTNRELARAIDRETADCLRQAMRPRAGFYQRR